MSRTPRDYQTEYRRRVARGLARGLSRSQARGHARAGDVAASPGQSSIDRSDPREKALKLMKHGYGQKQASRSVGISTERLRRYLKENTIARRQGKQWIIRDSRAQGFWIATRGRMMSVSLPTDEGSKVGHYWVAVNRFLETNNKSHLAPFVGTGVRDVTGRRHFFETGPNTLRRLDSAGEIDFLEIYADVAV